MFPSANCLLDHIPLPWNPLLHSLYIRQRPGPPCAAGHCRPSGLPALQCCTGTGSTLPTKKRTALPVAKLPPPNTEQCTPPNHTLTLLQALESGQRIVIDLDFEDKMSETEVKSLCQQLGYCYGENTRAKEPAHLILTSAKVGPLWGGCVWEEGGVLLAHRACAARRQPFVFNSSASARGILLGRE